MNGSDHMTCVVRYFSCALSLLRERNQNEKFVPRIGDLSIFDFLFLQSRNFAIVKRALTLRHRSRWFTKPPHGGL
jgi:hypothetical protein